jgi:hypothetical protein
MAASEINQLIELEQKDPLTRRIYTINLASPDGTNDGGASDTGFLQSRTISSVAVTTPSGITLVASSNTTLLFTLTISGGTADTRYEFDVLVTLSTAEVENITIIVPVVDVGSN